MSVLLDIGRNGRKGFALTTSRRTRLCVRLGRIVIFLAIIRYGRILKRKINKNKMSARGKKTEAVRMKNMQPEISCNPKSTGIAAEVAREEREEPNVVRLLPT